MLSFFALMFNGIILLFGLIVKGIFFLIRRFDITNSLVVGGGLAIIAYRIDIHPAIKWGVIIVFSVASFFLQHFFKPARIVFGVISSSLAGFIVYGITSEVGNISPFIPMAVAILVVGVLNLVSWLSISVSYKRD